MVTPQDKGQSWSLVRRQEGKRYNLTCMHIGIAPQSLSIPIDDPSALRGDSQMLCKVSAKTCSASTTLDEPATRIANLVTKIRKEDVSGRVYLQGRDRYR